ncbi:hypothetical protein LCGC14_1465100 [marine sediment metagenome]|uniref:Uncharacterized protein n=1 Tax=marine sediment metagenome TaxID=412755 RepID=A0A0F9JDX8_9ZZZZ
MVKQYSGGKGFLCRQGLHYPHKPFKHIPLLRNHIVCKRCGYGFTNLGNRKFEVHPKHLAEYYTPEYPTKLAKSAAFAALPNRLPYPQQVKIVGNMGHDVTKEMEDVERIEEALKGLPL